MAFYAVLERHEKHETILVYILDLIHVHHGVLIIFSCFFNGVLGLLLAWVRMTRAMEFFGHVMDVLMMYVLDMCSKFYVKVMLTVL